MPWWRAVGSGTAGVTSARCGATSRRGSGGRSRRRPSSTGATSRVGPTPWRVLVRSFLGRTADLGRSHLLAPFEHAPDVAALVAPLGPELEVRRIRTMTFQDEAGPGGRRAVEALHRPRVLVMAFRFDADGPIRERPPLTGVYRRIGRFVLEFRGGVALGLGLSAVSTLLFVLLPFPIKWLIDGVLIGDSLEPGTLR